MERFLLLVLAVCLLAVSHIGAFAFGAKWGQFQSALQENKLAVGNIDSSPQIDPQFREYLKARVYWNVRMYYPENPGYLIQEEWDRGAVNIAILGDVAAAKDPTAPILSWQSAISRANP